MHSQEAQPLLPSDRCLMDAARESIPSPRNVLTSTIYDARAKARNLLSSKFGHYAVLLLVSFDVGCIFADFLIALWVCEHTPCGQEKPGHTVRRLQDIQENLGIVSLIFSCLFVAELAASLWAFGLDFLKSKFHVFDALVILAGFIVDVGLKGVIEEVGSIVIVLRLWRVFKIIEEFSTAAEDRMEVLQEKIERLEVERSRLKDELATAKSIQASHRLDT